MLARLLLLFTLFPLVELVLLVALAQRTSLLFTLAVIVVTGVAGAWLARKQGTQCLRRIQAELSKGHMPGDSLVDGLMILVAGVLLITPGVLSDLVGISLLIPPIRTAFKRLVMARFKHRIVVSGFVSTSRTGPAWEDPIDVEHRPADRS